MGKNMLHLLQYAMKYPGWHVYATDDATLKAVKRLERLKLVETNKHQFRAVPPIGFEDSAVFNLLRRQTAINNLDIR